MSPGVERKEGCGDRFWSHEENGAGDGMHSDGGITALEATINKTHGLARFCGR
jgi:hypothetical protein